MRARRVPALALAVAAAAAGATPGPVPGAAPAPSPSVERWIAEPGWARHFRAAGVRGTFVLFDPDSATWRVYDRRRATTRYLPASTFKVLNTLVSLDAGAARDERDTLRWDGVDRGHPGWNADQDLRTAMARSTVWFYQELARRVGEERMRAAVRAAGYGNGDTGGGVDRFWLDGRLRISAVEQVRFLDRLRRGDLPFSARAMAIARDVLVRPRTGRSVLRSKTGWAARRRPGIGWYVGWVERDGRAWVFALNLEARRDADLPARETVAAGILGERGLLD